jgi:hypothetical protein
MHNGHESFALLKPTAEAKSVEQERVKYMAGHRICRQGSV